MKTLKLILSAVVCSLVLSAPVVAEGPGNGELTKHNVKLGDCVADSMTVRWNLDSLFGEAVVNGTYRYESADTTCSPPYSTVIWLKVEGAGGHGYVKLSLANPNRPGHWGFNAPGSPEWGEAVCGFEETKQTECMSEREAKILWKEGRVTDFDVAWGPSVAKTELREAEDALGLTREQRRQIQKSLAAQGFNAGPADGAFGPRTREAIRGWQSALNTEATGYLTELLAQALHERGGNTDESASDAPSESLAATEAVEGGDRALTPGTKFRDCPECPEMVVVPSGSFMMGLLPQEKYDFNDEEPRHRVTIGYPFAVGVHEVTRGEFARFVSATGHSMANSCSTEDGRGGSWENAGFSQSHEHPVVCVEWKDAKAFVRWLSGETGEEYRLLSESEWEYVARGGTETIRYWGDLESDQKRDCLYANGRDASSGFKEWTLACNDGHARTAPVGSYEANNFGLRDVMGNVWEWVEDCYSGGYRSRTDPNYTHNFIPRLSPDGSAQMWDGCEAWVIRGGGWTSGQAELRSAERGEARMSAANWGFRVARTLSP